MSAGFTGIVLAGGASRRMGRDKALLEIEGVPLLDRAIDLLRAAGAATVHVSGDRPAHGGIPDRCAGLGPVGGLASVLPHCVDGPALVLAVDQPALDVAALTGLLDAIDGAHAAAFVDHPLPLALRIDEAAREAVAAVLDGTPRGPSMRDLLHRLGAVRTPADRPRVLANTNTPADWAAFTA